MLILEGNLKWISTLGGPLILMERRDLSFWRGDDDYEDVSDYEMAGEITDYVGTVKFANRVALVFPMPNETSVVVLDKQTLLLIRWIFADTEDQVKNELLAMDLEQPWVETGVAYQIEGGNLVLFDSVFRGADVREFIETNVEPGTYTVSTLSHQPNETLNLFLIRLFIK